MREYPRYENEATSSGTGSEATNGEQERSLVADHDELFGKANEAAGGDLDSLTEFKPGWWQGQRPDGSLVKIEWETEGHATTNEGPHVTVRVPKDPSIGAKSG